jgi:6-methylsalicylate decarboxylase
VRIDTHIHLVPDGYRAVLDERSLSPLPLPPWSRDMTEEFMDRYEIDAAVISLGPPGVWFGDVGLAAELARGVNEATAELVRAAPQRFAGLAVLPLPDVDAALAELSHALDVLSLDGVALLSNVDLIYSGTLERASALRLQVAHLGGTAPFLAHRIASLAAREPDKAAAAMSGALAALARCWYDTGLSNHASAVEATASLIPLEKIVFGTDWPYAALPPAGDFAPELDALGDRRALVDSANAAALVPRLLTRP